MNKHGPSPRADQNATRPITQYGPKPKPLSERFWSKVLKKEGPDACWLWTGVLNGKTGYGMIYDADVGDKMLAHRAAWKLSYGSYPDGVVRHICDNNACVRIDHLVEGTQAENMRDKVARGRAKNQFGAHPLTFVGAEEIRAIYRGGQVSQEELARLYKVHQTNISRIILGLSYTTPVQEQPHPKADPPPRPSVPRPSVEDRFWAKVNKNGPVPDRYPELGSCWLWTAAVTVCTNGDQRGSFRRTHRRAELAHRVSWELTNGPIPEGMKICHRCDVGLCVRPDHLFLGTQAENIQDMRNKGRHRMPWLE